MGSPETLYSGDSGRGTGRWNAEENSEDLSLGAGKDNSRRTDIRLPVVRRKTNGELTFYRRRLPAITMETSFLNENLNHYHYHYHYNGKAAP